MSCHKPRYLHNFGITFFKVWFFSSIAYLQPLPLIHHLTPFYLKDNPTILFSVCLVVFVTLSFAHIMRINCNFTLYHVFSWAIVNIKRATSAFIYLPKSFTLAEVCDLTSLSSHFPHPYLLLRLLWTGFLRLCPCFGLLHNPPTLSLHHSPFGLPLLGRLALLSPFGPTGLSLSLLQITHLGRHFLPSLKPKHLMARVLPIRCLLTQSLPSLPPVLIHLWCPARLQCLSSPLPSITW